MSVGSELSEYDVVVLHFSIFGVLFILSIIFRTGRLYNTHTNNIQYNLHSSLSKAINYEAYKMADSHQQSALSRNGGGEPKEQRVNTSANRQIGKRDAHL